MRSSAFFISLPVRVAHSTLCFKAAGLPTGVDACCYKKLHFSVPARLRTEKCKIKISDLATSVRTTGQASGLKADNKPTDGRTIEVRILAVDHNDQAQLSSLRDQG